jgi:small subunit ribosomal protein S4
MKTERCKKCRRIGDKLFLKGERCFSPKCSLIRKPYAPGILGKRGSKRPKRGLSEYALQTKEKQKIKFNYGLREKQFANYVEKSNKKATKLFELLESRLDNAIFRIGFANSRSEAWQIVSHGHILVNGKKVNIPSYRVRVGDKISIKNFDIKIMKKYNAPAWIKVDKEKRESEICGIPLLADELSAEQSLNSIIEFYSR